MPLELRPNCECCDVDLPADSRAAYICSLGCTYCFGCAAEKLKFVCVNCGGELTRRPMRPAAMLVKYPASTVRVRRPVPC